jgi:hypothetical protein
MVGQIGLFFRYSSRVTVPCSFFILQHFYQRFADKFGHRGLLLESQTAQSFMLFFCQENGGAL